MEDWCLRFMASAEHWPPPEWTRRVERERWCGRCPRAQGGVGPAHHSLRPQHKGIALTRFSRKRGDFPCRPRFNTHLSGSATCSALQRQQGTPDQRGKPHVPPFTATRAAQLALGWTALATIGSCFVVLYARAFAIIGDSAPPKLR
jgi:hypothetical protein